VGPVVSRDLQVNQVIVHRDYVEGEVRQE